MGKLSDAEFREKLAERNPWVEPIGQYVDAKTPIPCRCRICGREWDAIPSNIMSGSICRPCAIKRAAAKARKTNEEFLKDLAIKNPDVIPLESYIDNRTKILVRCKKCGKTWPSKPGNLLSGKACKTCGNIRTGDAQRKDRQQFLEELKLKNPTVEAIGDYVKSDIKIEFKCLTCGHVWPAKPSHILAGHGCPKCGGSQKKDQETFVSELKNINPYIDVLGEYKNARTKILCRCQICTAEFPASPDKLLQGAGCTKCDKRSKTSFPEQAILYYVKQSYPEAINRYHGDLGSHELDIYIPSLRLGIEYDGVYYHSNPQRDRGKYNLCNENGITLIRIIESEAQVENTIADKIILRKKPYRYASLDSCIDELLDYMGCKTDVDTLRDSVSIRELYYTNLGESSLQTKYPEVADEWLFSKNGLITPQMVSYGSNEKYWWKCKKCQHEWKAAVCERTVRGKGCPECKNVLLSKKFAKSNEKFVAELKEVNPYIEPLEPYQRTHTDILFRCLRCGKEWPAAPANVLRGRDCPVCSRKRGIEKMKRTKQRQKELKNSQ